MPSKPVIDREKSTRAVAAAAETHAADVAAGWEKVLGKYLESGESMPDVGLTLRLCARWMQAANAALVEADAVHERELADDVNPRAERDESAERLRRSLVDLRDAVEAAYGEAGLRALGMAETVPIDPSELAATGREVAGRLRDEDLELPPSRRRGFKLDRVGLAGEIEAQIPPLQQALEAVARETSEAEATLAVRRAAMEYNDNAFRRGGSIISNAMSISGLDEIADRIRPSDDRPGETNASPDEGARADAATDSPTPARKTIWG